MTPIDGPAPLPRCLDDLLATARQARCTLRVPPPTRRGTPAHIDGDRLFAYWEDTLDADTRCEVEDHASSCEECRQWLEEIGKMFGTLSR